MNFKKNIKKEKIKIFNLKQKKINFRKAKFI